MSLIQPLVFTGISQYSSDFQSILNRAVQLASLPAQQLQNRQSDIRSQETLATNLSSAVSDLASQVGALGLLGDSKGIVATSDSDKVTATAAGATSNAFYSITEITSV